MSPDYLAKALPALRARIQRSETRLSMSARPMIAASINEFEMAIDAAGPRSDRNMLVADVRDIVRQCLGALFVFELNADAHPEAEDSLVHVIRDHATACRTMILAHRASSSIPS